MKQVLRQKLQQKMTPQQILLMKLIQLPATELEMRLKKEIEENPVLEEKDQFENLSTDESSDFDDDDSSPDSDDFDVDYFHEDEEEVQGPVQKFSEQGEQFFSLTSQESFQEDLLEQMAMKVSNETEMIIAKFLVGSLDDSGYLRRELYSLVDDIAFTQHIDVELEQVKHVLHLLQQLEPAGIGAQDLREALLLQLKRKDQHDLLIKNATYIIEHLFDDFSHRRYEKIVEKTNISEEDLKLVLDEITSLNPKPGESQGDIEDVSSTIIPDFNVSVVGDEIIISLNDSTIPDLTINKDYLEMVKSYEKSSDKNLKKTAQFIKQKVDSANWFIEALKQRDDTLMRTMQTIVSLQRDFFLGGDMKLLKPMILKDIADLIEMDISTVSRVVNSKYVQTQSGIFKLKKFFSESFTKEGGEEVSTNQVKLLLKDIVEAEDKQSPLKDDELTEILKEKGYPVARRTVAKYREQLGLPVARLRRNI